MTPAPFPGIDHTAPCTQVDPDLFFFEAAGRQDLKVAAAKKVCESGCPFREPCLAYALTNKVDGVWSATTPDERAKIRKRQGIKATPVSFADAFPEVRKSPAIPGDHPSWGAIDRHRRNHEPVCDKCRVWQNEKRREYRARGTAS